ncbi:hypothetical protein NEUTE1DRAFT_138111 [Neurospora tetrasperma FGSC 2508]|uniref:Uncharacterized protein n=1 Tax=Neurospora tetrasperma (strain FGSC 2508 / ATCC MYA-4615 / P0657) TaxID=510951 RepID=F8MLA9_NEUT8|nr:uncharacterized protein NEUTE1DRAFT_138111 [Neurospora tetrasperma FGSC 2508]EGO58382.1 hypothetical protein NEUTE1DRAFT_138111 [Neurospora tetrasperma FGSC 2508]EGZ71289.1 hypothetical protein NEUTE2DRAFT_166363 [Neurospora tetrasperma FGSC 2509]
MADISRSQALLGIDGDPTKEHMAFKTTFGGHNDAYPIELLKDSSYVFPHDTKVDTHSHDIINHDLLDDAEHLTDDTHDFGIDKEKIGAYRLFTDDLIDPILLNWEKLTKTGAFAIGPFPTAISTTGNLHIVNPDPVAGFNAHLSAKPDGTHPHIASHKKNTPKKRSKKGRKGKRPGYCTECDEKQVQIAEWAAQGILTCTDCIRRPQRAPGKLCTHCFKGGKDDPNVLNPIFGASNTTRDDSIQPASTHHIAISTDSNLQVAPAAGSSTLVKCRECKVGTA